MSQEIDERIVQMKFDNQGFADKTKETMSALDKLNEKLKFKDSAQGFDNISRSASKVNFGGITSGVEKVKAQFSAMDIAFATVVSNITTQAMNLGHRLASEVFVQPLRDGFAEYEEKIGSTKTMVNALVDREEYAGDRARALKDVNQALQDLNTYSDKTIYSFKDMTANIGKFINSGVDLKNSVGAIKGVANEAALAGANTNEAAHAMYNFAQGLSAGYIKLIDWKSIENANMATVSFKNQLIRTAEAMGTVKKNGDGMYEVLTTNASGAKMKDVLSATHAFNDSLQYQWMTSQVLTETLNQYATDIRDFASDNSGKKQLDDYAKGLVKFNDLTEEAQEQVGEYEQHLKEIGYDDAGIKQIEQLGINAADAATHVTTFTQMIGSLKEALGSGWTETWQMIFGDLDQATNLWTKIYNAFSSMIDDMTDRRIKFITGWSDAGGRDALINTIGNLYHAIMKPLQAIGEAFTEVFRPLTGEQFAGVSKSIEAFTKKLIISDETAEKLKSVFKIIFGILQTVGDAIVLVAQNLGRLLLPIAKTAIKIIGVVVVELAKVVEFLQPIVSGIVTTVISNLKELISTVSQYDVVQKFADAFGKVKDKLSEVLGLFSGNTKGISGRKVSKYASSIQRIKDALSDVGKILGGVVFKAISKVFNVVKDLSNTYILPHIDTDAVADWFQNIGKNIAIFAENFAEDLPNKIESLKTSFHNLKESLGELGDTFKRFFTEKENPSRFFTELKDTFKGFFTRESVGDINGTASALKGFSDATKPLSGGKIANNIKSFFKKIKSGFQIFTGNVSLKGVLQDVEKLLGILVAFKVSGSIKNLTDIIGGLGSYFKSEAKLNTSFAIKNVAISIGILAASLLALSFVPIDKLWGVVAVLSVMAGVITLCAVAFEHFKRAEDAGDALGGFLSAIANSVKKFLRGAGRALTGIGIAAMVGSLLLLVGLIEKIVHSNDITAAKLKEKKEAFGIIGGIFVAMAAAMSIIGKVGGTASGLSGIGMLAMVMSMEKMVKIINDLQNLEITDYGSLLKKLGVLGAIIFGLGAIMKFVGGSGLKSSIGVGIQMVALVGVVAVLTKCIAILSTLSMQSVITGGAVIAGMMLAVGGMIRLSSMGAQLKPSVFFTISIMIGTLTAAVYILGAMDVESLAQGIIAIGLCLVMVGGLMKAQTAASGLSATAFLGIAATLVALSAALKVISEIDTTDLAKSVISIIAVLGSISLMFVALSKLVLFNWTAMLATAGMIVIVLATITAAFLALDHFGKADNYIKISASIAIALLSIAAVCAILGLLPIVAALKASANLLIFVGALTGIFAILGGLNKIDGFHELMTSGMNQLVEFGNALGDFIAAVVTPLIEACRVDQSCIDGMNAVAKCIMAIGAASVISALNGVLSIFKINPMEDLKTNMTALGEAVSGFAKVSSGVSDWSSVQSAADATATLFTALKSMPRTGGIFEKLIGEKDISNVGSILGAFGSGISAFAASVSGVKDWSTVGTAADNGTKIFNALSQMPTDGGLLGFVFKGNQDFSAVGNQLRSFGFGIASFASQVSSVSDWGLVPLAADAAKSLFNALSQAPNSGGLVGLIVGNNDMDANFTTGITRLGTALSGFAHSTSNVDSGQVTNVANSAKNLFIAMSEIPNTGIFGGIDVKGLGDALKTLGSSLASFAERISGIDFNIIYSFRTALSGLLEAAGMSADAETINAFVYTTLPAINNMLDNVPRHLVNFVGNMQSVSLDTLTLALSAVHKVAVFFTTLKDVGASADFAASFIAALKGLSKLSFSAFTATFSALYPNIMRLGKDLITNLQNGILAGRPGLLMNIAVTCSLTYNQFSQNLSSDKFYSIGLNICRGLKNGIISGRAGVINAAVNTATKAYMRVKASLDVNSPSKKFYALGKFVDLGFANGISENSDAVNHSVQTMADNTIENMKLVAATLAASVDDSIDSNPVITPVLDLSKIQGSTADLNSTLSLATARNIRVVNGGVATSDQNSTGKTVNTTYGNMTINVYGAPGQDVNELARLVENRITTNIRRQREVYGNG